MQISKIIQVDWKIWELTKTNAVDFEVIHYLIILESADQMKTEGLYFMHKRAFSEEGISNNNGWDLE